MTVKSLRNFGEKFGGHSFDLIPEIVKVRSKMRSVDSYSKQNTFKTGA